MRSGYFVVSVLAVVSLGNVSCATLSTGHISNEATPEAYAKDAMTKGVVILDVNWGRKWQCGDFENAEIMSIGFDRLPIEAASSETPSVVLLDGPARLTKRSVFRDYAMLLEPGEYALTSFHIKVARSESDVGHLVANKSHLIEDGKPKGGTFSVKAGESVYIGNFFLDCYRQPIIWRYYTPGGDGFKKHMSEVRDKYPFVDPTKVQYRLFKTMEFGESYELPK